MSYPSVPAACPHIHDPGTEIFRRISHWLTAPPATNHAETDQRHEWSDEEIVLLHWRLLQEICELANPASPLEEKLDTLQWVFADPDQEDAPFSFARCVRVVGCSPLSPIAYCGKVDTHELQRGLRTMAKAWLDATVARYPSWVREAFASHPAWIASHLARNPQWLNEQIHRHRREGDLFN